VLAPASQLKPGRTFAAKGDILEVSCTSADDVEVAVPPHRHDVRNPAACTCAYEAAQQNPSPSTRLRVAGRSRQRN
jgi:hypothetical protein